MDTGDKIIIMLLLAGGLAFAMFNNIGGSLFCGLLLHGKMLQSA